MDFNQKVNEKYCVNNITGNLKWKSSIIEERGKYNFYVVYDQLM